MLLGRLDEEIGNGAYGVVYKASLNESQCVAIKYLRDGQTQEAELAEYLFLEELSTMAFVNLRKGGHPNVIALVGGCTRISLGSKQVS